MFEVEMKFRIAGPDPLLRLLHDRFGADFGPERIEQDLYFQHPCRDFVQTDEAFRLRRAGSDLKITYKGPKLDKKTKTREEIELPLLSAEAESVEERLAQWRRMLERLGFRPAASVEKRRRAADWTYQGLPFEAALDYLEPLGWFVELETITSGPFEAARDTLLTLAAELGLTDSVTESYLNLLQKAEESRKSKIG